MSGSTAIAVILVVVGFVGIVIPVLPGLIFIALGALVLAVAEGGTLAWAAFAVCAIVFVVALVIQILVPGRRLQAQGISNWTLVLAMGVALVGLFVIPVVGAPLGFVVTIYAVEIVQGGTPEVAWEHTKHAVVAILLSKGIELIAGVAMVAIFAIAAIKG